MRLTKQKKEKKKKRRGSIESNRLYPVIVPWQCYSNRHQTSISQGINCKLGNLIISFSSSL